ncbi:hypothetical protein N7540_000137 [Penicillium herquei]|nr:hypothetical protein N7540_000137 [Penicillium herquei]
MDQKIHQKRLQFIENVRIANPQPPDHDMNAVAGALGQEYQATGDITNLKDCIELFSRLVNNTPDDLLRSLYLSNLGNALGMWFSHTKQRSDLEKALVVLRQAREFGDPRAPVWPVIINNLLMRLEEYYGFTEETEYLDPSISMSQVAIDTTPMDDQDRPRRLHNLANSLCKRFRLCEKNSKADLENGICIIQEAVRITPPGYPGRAQWYTSLGDAIYDKYLMTNQDEHLEESLKMSRKGLQAAVRGEPAWPAWLNNFSFRLRAIYTRTREVEYLREAIDMARQSLQATSADDPERVRRSLNLANCLCDKFNSVGMIQDLTESIEICQEFADDDFPDTGQKADLLHHIGVSLGSRYERTKSPVDLTESIRLLQRAVDVYTPASPNKATALSNLGNSLARDALRLKDKFWQSKSASDINHAIEVATEAIQEAPMDHLIQGDCLEMAGIMFHERYKYQPNLSDMEKTKEYLIKALKPPRSSIIVRIRATREFLSLPGIGDDPTAYRIAIDAVNLVPQLAKHAMHHADKQSLLIDAVAVASNASSLALHTGHGTKAAIQLLETGRCIIASAAFGQADIDKLTATNPEMAKLYLDVQTRLGRIIIQASGSSILLEAALEDPNTGTERQTCIRAETERELVSLTEKIRASNPDFHRFLIPVSDDEIITTAKHGPIIMVNVSSRRCDALIVDATGIREQPLRLPNISKQELETYSGNLASTDTLEWLWDRIVFPILDSLGDTAWAPDCKIRRVWWIPTGELTKFPLHAAGYHRDGLCDTALDRLVSSDATSINAIIRGRRQYDFRSELHLNTTSAWV